jgi:hypothetical protein
MVVPVHLNLVFNMYTCAFSVTNCNKLLGMEITPSPNNRPQFYLNLREDDKIVRFWECFCLTLPGRNTLLKTLLLRQLNYLGCFLTPSAETWENIQRILDKFVTKILTFLLSAGNCHLSCGAL